jgi:transposase
MRFVIGNSRFQQSFLSLDDRISSSNSVRYIDEICNEFLINYLDSVEKDTDNKGNKDTGRKAYHPGDLLKLLVYGYFNGVSSSRKLETECLRNLEVQWLLSGLVPDHKTIADFRKDNPELIRGLFVFLIKWFSGKGIAVGKKIAVDGTKIKAYASKEIRLDGLKKKLKNIEQQVEKYMADLAKIDDLEDFCEEAEEKKAQLIKEIEVLESKKKGVTEAMEGLEAEGLSRKCLTDPDSKTMKGRYGHYLGYNFQIAVDIENHILTDYQLNNLQNDKGLLSSMVAGSQDVTGQKPQEAQADAGYYKATEIEELEMDGTACYVAVNQTHSKVNDQENGLEFIYDKEKDHYKCSGGRILEYSRKKTEQGYEKRIYKSKDCSGCALLDLCTKPGSKDKNRTYTRNHNQEWIDTYRQKMKSKTGKEKMKQRKASVEHPFGTMKYYMGQMPTLLRGKEKVSIEMGLYSIAYNLKRFLAINAQNPTKSGSNSGILDFKFLFLFTN